LEHGKKHGKHSPKVGQNHEKDLQVFYQLRVPWATKVQEFFVHELEPHPSLMTLGNIG
jgi:hypothetical protein